MARISDLTIPRPEPSKTGAKRGAAPKYDWDNWLDGRTWELLPDVDYHTSFGSFRQAAEIPARIRNKRVVVVQTLTPNGEVTLIRAFSRDPEITPQDAEPGMRLRIVVEHRSPSTNVTTHEFTVTDVFISPRDRICVQSLEETFGTELNGALPENEKWYLLGRESSK